MTHPSPAPAVGSLAWCERTGGVLTARERWSLAGLLLRDELAIVRGRVAMALRLHAGRRRTLDPSVLLPPDSALTRDAEEAAQDLLSPALLNHSRRSYAWGAGLGALEGIDFDRELLYVAAMLHDTGLPTPLPGVDFTLRSVEVARSLAEAHELSATQQAVVFDAITLHHSPGVSPDHGHEAHLLSAGAGVDVFGLRSGRLPDAVRRQVVAQHPRAGFKDEFARLFHDEAALVPHGRAWYLHRYAVSDVSIRLAPFRG